MRVQQITWSERSGWMPKFAPDPASLVLYFGTRQALADGARYDELRDMFPAAHILGCSTGGQINNSDVNDDEIVAAAVTFDATALRLCHETVDDPQQSQACGEAIGRALAAADLAGVFVLSDGLHVNGSALVAGITKVIGPGRSLDRRPRRRRRGLPGDAGRRRLRAEDRTIAAIGLYGSAVRVGHGSAGGWDMFGPRRQVTKSVGNVLFELDGQPALDLYERYLGPDESKELPGSALLFPIQVYDLAHPDWPWSARCWRLIATTLDDVRGRRAARLDGAIDARKSRPLGGRRGRGGTASPQRS